MYWEREELKTSQIKTFNHQAPQETWAGHNVSVEQMPGETVCKKHASSHLEMLVLTVIITTVLMTQVEVLKTFAFTE